MRSHPFDSGVAEHAVVGVPAEDLIREEVEILVDPEAAGREDVVERYAVRAIRVSRQQVLLHRISEPARGVSVLGRDDAVGDERTIEGDDRVAASSERVVPEAKAVVHRPR